MLQLLYRGVAFLANCTSISATDDDRRFHDADLIGEYNYRTGHLDVGTDPYGRYDED
ncbi:MAG: hypothetical protein O3C28_14205 [Proteobacteria bacterium]|nr:hypothetical protein [Pseudomonadota bacterium]